MIGTFSQGLCDSGKRHWPTTCDIVVTIFVIDCRIDRVLGTPLSRISHDLCTSLIVRLSYPSPISHGLHTSSSQCQTCAACIEYSLHISKMYLVVEWLYQPWLVHISMLASANKRQHHPSLVRIGKLTFENNMKHRQDIYAWAVECVYLLWYFSIG